MSFRCSVSRPPTVAARSVSSCRDWQNTEGVHGNCKTEWDTQTTAFGIGLSVLDSHTGGFGPSLVVFLHRPVVQVKPLDGVRGVWCNE